MPAALLIAKMLLDTVHVEHMADTVMCHRWS
jgi:hypothetical protein